MGNPQDPNAPPTPFERGDSVQPLPEPPAASPQTPQNPPAQLPAFEGVPNTLLASNAPEPAPPAPGMAPPVVIPQQSSTQPAWNAPVIGGGPVAEAQRAQRNNAAENRAVGKDLKQAADNEITAQNEMSRVQRNEADQKAIAVSEENARQAKLNADEQAGNVAYNVKRTKLEDNYNKAIADQDAFVFDPDQYINKMSLGSKIFTVIAIGLSGMGNSRSIGGSGGNLALDGLNDSIRANVDAQKQQYQRLGDRVGRAQSAYARAREMHMDDAQATLAAKQASIAQHEMAIKTITARYDPERIDAARQQMVAHLGSEAAKTRQAFTQMAHAEGERDRSAVFQAQQGVFGMGVQAENLRLNEQEAQWKNEDRLANRALQAAQLDEKAREAELKAQGKGPGAIPGWLGEAPTPDQKNKAAELSGTERILTRKLGELLQFKSDYGNETLNRSEIAKAKSTAAQVKVALKDQFKLGVMSDSDSQLLDNVANDPTKVSWSPATVAQLQHLIEQVHADADDQMEGYGLHRDRDYKPRVQIDAKPKEGGK